jgi:choline dehydrogenase
MDDVAPYFQRAEGREGGDAGGAAGYGTDGPTRIEDLRDPSPATTDFLAACAAAGLPPLGDGEMPARGGAGPVRATQRNGRRWSSADAYLRRPQENLSVITGCHVTRVLIEGSRAVGIEYRTGQGSFRIAAAREVIIAAGAVGSPQLLMLSGIGDADHLRAQGIGVQSHSPEVGRNLGDHLYLPLAFAAREPVSPGIGDMSGEIARYVRERRGRLTSNIAEAVAFLRSSDEVTAPDLEFVWMLLPFLGRGEPTDHGVTLGVVLLRPASSGQIRLRSADPHVHPVIDPGYLSDAGREDLRVLTAGVRRAGEVLRQPALSRWLGAPLTPEPARDGPEATQSLIRSGAETLFHPVGTCRMGAEPGTVLDLQFRVRGVAGLRVVDASAMPSIPRGHTHAPTVMLAERAADMILDRAAGRQLPNPRKDVQEQ